MMRQEDLIGLDILVGLTYFSAKRKLLRQEQFYGWIDEIKGGTTWIRPCDGGDRRWIPTESGTIRPAPGGSYRLASTGQVVSNPLLITSWMLTEAVTKTGQKYYDATANYAPLHQSRVPDEWQLTYVKDESRIRRAIAMFGDDYIGKNIILGVNYVGPDGNLRSQEQFVGMIMVLDYEEGIVISCEPDGWTFVMANDPAWVERGSNAEYRLRSTGQLVVNPDFLAEVTLQQTGH